MTPTISPQVRLIAVIGLLAAAALVVSTQLVSRGLLFSGDSEPAAVPASVAGSAKKENATKKSQAKADATKRPAKADAKNATATTDAAKADTQSTAATGTTAKAATKARTATATKAATKRPLRTRGLPVPLARELQKKGVVVVSLYTPNAAVDAVSRAEAWVGARETGAGFVALNVLNRKNSERLAAKLGVVKAPSVLVYRRPAKLFVKLDGFADAATVAQAAENARP